MNAKKNNNNSDCGSNLFVKFLSLCINLFISLISTIRINKNYKKYGNENGKKKKTN